MLIEITEVKLHKESKILVIHGIDVTKCRDANTVTRTRDIEIHRECVFDTKDEAQFKYVTKWLHRQKITAGCQTYGEALRAVVGTVTQIRSWYS